MKYALEMSARKNKTFTLAALAAILAVSTVLHFWRISYPSRPLFDEAHFATYAADYATHRAFYDIHPPFGKLMYAAVLSFVMPGDFSGASEFIVTKLNPKTNHLDTTDAGLPFGDFPYVPLRAASAVVGILLPLVFYGFLRALGLGTVGSSLGALFVALENALLLDTRLILLNTMFIVLGLAALTLYFQNNRRPVAGGVVWGLALATKLSAIVFLAPVVIGYYLIRSSTNRKENHIFERSLGKKFFFAGIAVLILISSLNLVFFSTHDRLNVLESLGWLYKGPAASSSAGSTFLASVGATAVDVALSLSNYVEGPPHPQGSPWYLWPAMQIPMPFYGESDGASVKQIVLQGNYVIWFSATLAVVVGFAVFYRYLRGYLRPPLTMLAQEGGRKEGDVISRPSDEANSPAGRQRNTERTGADVHSFFLLLGGYIGALLPFFTLVRRSTFLYHYFPALLFAIGLLVWFLARALRLEDFDTLNKKQIFFLSLIILAAVGGFLWTAPVTYGL